MRQTAHPTEIAEVKEREFPELTTRNNVPSCQRYRGVAESSNDYYCLVNSKNQPPI